MNFIQVRLVKNCESIDYFKSTDMTDWDLKSREELLDSQSSSYIADINSSGYKYGLSCYFTSITTGAPSLLTSRYYYWESSL